MTFRGFFSLNGTEFANSSRVAAHLGADTPLTDADVFTPDDPTDCGLTPWAGHPGLYEISDDMVEVSPGLWTLPNGARRFGPGLYDVGDCWGPASLCSTCRTQVSYDDSWPGLREFLGSDTVYRPELAPWYTTELSESGEFGGVWVLDVKGLDATPVDRPITQTVGHGAVAGPYRDTSRTLTFDALLIACSHAGVEYGLKWLDCLLRATNDDMETRLRYLEASPAHSLVDAASLVREAHGVVLTRSPEVQQRINTLGGQNRHANMYRVSWEMTVLSPYAYLPQIRVPVDWDSITQQPINWIHAADCAKPETCLAMPILFSTECVPEEIDAIQTPPPVCGGCMPVGGLTKYLFRVPTHDYVFRCRETAVSVVVSNTGEDPLTLQAFWRECNTDIRCEDNQFPLQVAGLPVGAELHLDGINGRYRAWFDGRWHLPSGVVGTPNGAPWRPPVIDRQLCWDFIVQTASTAEFEVSLTLSDRGS